MYIILVLNQCTALVSAFAGTRWHSVGAKWLRLFNLYIQVERVIMIDACIMIR